MLPNINNLFKKDKKNKELTVSQSIKKVKEMFNTNQLKTKRDTLRPGNLAFCVYNAKDKSQTYDKRPFIILLKQNKSHILGLNFHWLPLPFRVSLVKLILKLNKRNLLNNKPLEFSYLQFKPYLKKYGYAPCIRLYIRKRMSSNVILVTPDRLMEAARLNAAVFNNGESAEKKYKKAIKGNVQYRKTRKRRE